MFILNIVKFDIIIDIIIPCNICLILDIIIPYRATKLCGEF